MKKEKKGKEGNKRYKSDDFHKPNILGHPEGVYKL